MRLSILSTLIAVIASTVFFPACQTAPTKVSVQEPVISGTMTAEKIMAENPVILDVRPPFEFNLAHVPGSINVRWEDFSQQDPRYRGSLQTDLFAVARRLSLIGVDPDTKVVVLGKGRQGAGEEGRVAWTLQVLGVKDVYTLVNTSYRSTNPKDPVAPVKNKPYWKPQVNESLTISFENFKAYAYQQLPPMKYSSHARRSALGGVDPMALNGPPEGVFGMNFNDAKGKVVILDVRSHQEFAMNNITRDKNVKAPVVNIEWREFFDDKGLPAKNIDKLMTDKGIGKDRIVMVISNHGVRSGSVTYALRAAGYRQSVNYAGGYEQWK